MYSRDNFWESGEADDAAIEIDTALPLVIDPAWSGADDEIDQLFAPITERLSPPESESLGSALRAIGRWASRAKLDQVAAQAAPIVGTAAGTAIGGPVGAIAGKAIGDKVGQMAATGKAPAVAIPGPAAAIAATAPAPAPGGPGNESQAAAQLLYLVQNPGFLSGLVSLALGSRGQPTVPAGPGGAPVGVGALVNLASTLAAKATDDADALAVHIDGDSETYLTAPSTCPSCDPAVGRDRADALLAFLQAAGDDAGFDDPGEGFDDWFDEERADDWFDERW